MYKTMITAGCLFILSTGGTVTMGMESKKLSDLKQPPLNTTMMGVLKGVSDYYSLNLDEPMIFGLSGHAFLININKQLCPSGPYCWKRENSMPLIENMGMKMTDLGFYGAEATEDARSTVEKELREALDSGSPCSLMNMENQIICGYDKDGFCTAQPWAPSSDFPPDRLSFGSWREFGDQCHVNFYTLEQVAPEDQTTAMLESLNYAIDMWKNPAKHSSQNYGVGPMAYDNWIAAIPSHGSSHGQWWNATVWSECRNMAADFFDTIGKSNKKVSEMCSLLNDEYTTIGKNLQLVSNKEMPAADKIALLKETKELEAAAIDRISQLVDILRPSK